MKNAVAEAENLLAGRGRLLLRYSGTENLARVMVEADDQKMAGSVAEQVAQVVRLQLGE